jgi:hypothetical protein
VSSYITSIFTPKKGSPINSNSSASDSYEDEEDKAKFGSVSQLSYGSNSASPTDETRLLSPTAKKTATRDARIRKVGKVAQKVTKGLASFALGHVAPGAGGAFSVPALVSTLAHQENLKLLIGEDCVAGQKEICQGMLAYVLNQKDRALGDAVLKCTPILGTLATVMEKFHWLDKALAGSAGEQRMAQAKKLVDHAKECHVALAIYAEVVCKDSTKAKNWEKALKDIEENSEAWGASDEDPKNPAAEKLAGKLKPTK